MQKVKNNLEIIVMVKVIVFVMVMVMLFWLGQWSKSGYNCEHVWNCLQMIEK